MKEYIVTLKDRKFLEEFYYDMETEGGKLFIPNRKVSCCKRRNISRNTHYLLTDEEAEVLRNDERVLCVSLKPEDLGISIMPLGFRQESNDWNKNSTNNSSHRNWGLLRCVEGEQRPNWGSNGTSNQSGEIVLTSSGKNVDVVIVDGHIDPNHPEMLDENGNTRVIQYNWLGDRAALGFGTNGNYSYSPYGGDEDNHGIHVAGNVAGNTQGWARGCNIYNVSPYGDSPIPVLELIDHIRYFHNNKSINPLTRRKNPTITNHSWGFGISAPISEISEIGYRGNTISGPFTSTSELFNDYGINSFNNSSGIDFFKISVRYPAFEADIEDAIADGIIFVAAAGNDYMKMDIQGGIDFNNYLTRSSENWFYHSGNAPSSANGVICVGAVSSLSDERKANFSNCGPRVDVYAPGVNTMSSLYVDGQGIPVQDPRDTNYYMGKYSGTSMACPQVCGILACLLENFPDLKQEECLQIIKDLSKSSQLFDSGTDNHGDTTSLQGSNNKYLFYLKIRKEEGNIFPMLNYKPRPSSGLTYPRKKIRI